MLYLIARASLKIIIAALLFAVFFVPSSRAETANVIGRYQCDKVKIRGKMVPCKAAPLTLGNDGRFELQGWEGSYLVNGEWLEMSDTLLRTRAKIEPGHKIILRYSGRHGLVEMIFVRRVAEMGNTSLT